MGKHFEDFVEDAKRILGEDTRPDLIILAASSMFLGDRIDNISGVLGEIVAALTQGEGVE